MTAAGRKLHLAARFDAAAARYDAHSPLQREAALRLARRVLALSAAPPRRVLEIGCGTGHLTRALCERIGGEWTLSDIAPAMVRGCAGSLAAPHNYLIMDAERPALKPASFDLIVSSLTAQWFAHLPQTLAALCALLAPGGRLALATLGRGTFAEWRRAHQVLGLLPATHDYPDAAELARAFPADVRTEVSEESITMPLGSPLDFVRGLRAIGADMPRAGTRPLGAGQLRRVLRQLAADAPEGITYRLLYAVAERPA